MKFLTSQARPAGVRAISSIFCMKCSFREISMIKMVILDHSKPMSLIIIHKNGNKTSIQPILKSNSTSFTFKNIFCQMNIKKITHGEGLGEGGNRPNFLF